MEHPELIGVPVLMLADYLLTILGAKSSARVHGKHFTTPSYELNPLWRKSVDQRRWFNPRHLANLLLFRYLNRNPEEISGQVELSPRLVIKMSQVGYLGLVPLFAFLAVLAPHRYTLGALLGLLTLVLAHFIWGWRAGRAPAPSRQA